MKTNLADIPETMNHDKTVYKKSLLEQMSTNSKIATYNYARLLKGMTLKPHAHKDGLEYYLFLEGRGKMMVGKVWGDVGKGDFVIVSLGDEHSLQNNENEDLIFLTLRTIVE